MSHEIADFLLTEAQSHPSPPEGENMKSETGTAPVERRYFFNREHDAEWTYVDSSLYGLHTPPLNLRGRHDKIQDTILTTVSKPISRPTFLSDSHGGILQAALAHLHIFSMRGPSYDSYD
jgi:hypothetical protein